MEEIELAYRDASLGRPAERPVIEMTIPSAVDPTLAPPGQHVAQLFVQFAPYSLAKEVCFHRQCSDTTLYVLLAP